MTKRFAIQCLLNGIEADMISELFTILEGFPCGVRDQDGNVRLSVPACDYEKVRMTASYFATKFEGLEDRQEGLVDAWNTRGGIRPDGSSIHDELSN